MYSINMKEMNIQVERKIRNFDGRNEQMSFINAFFDCVCMCRAVYTIFRLFVDDNFCDCDTFKLFLVTVAIAVVTQLISSDVFDSVSARASHNTLVSA